ncbi:MAG TPA: ABC transporter substrate-binding protein [Acidimicrobiia bacterium]|nr:ABC transporter substrate-binding protein [Acidimicrobiia bacterium]
MKGNRRLRFLSLVAVFSLAVTACGGDTSDSTTTTAAEGPTTTDEPTTTTAGAEACSVESLNLVNPGQLTVATGEPVFPPWMGVGDENFDVPESGTGFEGAMVYELADELGISDDQVTFVRTAFDEAIAPGPKEWDFNIQQYSITEERDEVVDFSDPYYETQQALVTFADSAYADGVTVEDLQEAMLGAAIGTTSLDFVEDVIQPDTEVSVYDENVDVEAAMNAGQIDGLVVDLPTAYFITAAQIEGTVIAGVFEAQAESPDQFGLLFEEDNPLVECVNEALTTLRDDGTLAALEEEWLTQEGAVPTISG